MRRYSTTLALCAVFVAGCTRGDRTAAIRTCFHDDLAFESEVGYCQAVRVGQTLYVSGNAARGDMPAAIRTVYADLGKTLEANGLTFANVVKETVYATDLEAFIQNKDIRKQAYLNTPLPAATWVQVQRLYSPANVLEIELVAAYPE